MTTPLSRVKITIEALTVDGELIVVSVPRELPTPQEATDWPYPQPPQGQDPITWIVDEASKRTRAALDAMEPKGSRTFGEANPHVAGVAIGWDEQGSATFGARPTTPVQQFSDVRQDPDTSTFAKQLQDALEDVLDCKPSPDASP